MSFLNKNFLKVPQVPLKSFFKEVGNNPFVDWLLILIVSFVTAVLLSLGGVSLYFDIIKNDSKGEQETQQSIKKVFDRNELESVIEYFKKRKAESLDITNGYDGPSDPSI